MVDTETGEYTGRRLEHENARKQKRFIEEKNKCTLALDIADDVRDERSEESRHLWNQADTEFLPSLRQGPPSAPQDDSFGTFFRNLPEDSAAASHRLIL